MAQQIQRNSSASNVGHFALYSSTLTATIYTTLLDRAGLPTLELARKREILVEVYKAVMHTVTTLHVPGLIYTETNALQPEKLELTVLYIVCPITILAIFICLFIYFILTNILLLFIIIILCVCTGYEWTVGRLAPAPTQNKMN